MSDNPSDCETLSYKLRSHVQVVIPPKKKKKLRIHFKLCDSIFFCCWLVCRPIQRTSSLGGCDKSKRLGHRWAINRTLPFTRDPMCFKSVWKWPHMFEKGPMCCPYVVLSEAFTAPYTANRIPYVAHMRPICFGCSSAYELCGTPWSSLDCRGFFTAVYAGQQIPTVLAKFNAQWWQCCAGGAGTCGLKGQCHEIQWFFCASKKCTTARTSVADIRP